MRGGGRICIIGCILLGAPAFGDAAPGAAEPAVQGDQAPGGNPLWGIPINQLSATRDRPIFSPSRRPPPPAIVDPPVAAARPVMRKPAEPERPQLSLLGTIVNGDDGFGIFIDQATRASLRIRIGETYQGWTLSLLHPGSVTLVNGRDSAVLAFPKQANDEAAPPVQPIAAQAAKSARHPSLTGRPPMLNPSPQSTAVRAQARIFGTFGNPALQQ
jgi:hypothetical protein